MDQSPTQTPENQQPEHDYNCRNERVLNTEGPKCEKPAQKNVHRWGNCVLPADHAGFCYYRDSDGEADGEARQANYGTAENPARCSDAMDRAGRLQHLRLNAYLGLRIHWGHEEAARMVKEAGDSESALNKLIGKIPKHLPVDIMGSPRTSRAGRWSQGAAPQTCTVDPSSKNVLTHMGEISRAVDKLIAQRDEALVKVAQLELANAALRKAAGL